MLSQGMARHESLRQGCRMSGPFELASSFKPGMSGRMLALRIALVLGGSLLAGSVAGAQSQSETSFTQALLAARQPLVLSSSELSGSGAATLRAAVQPARYVLLGEDHFTREIPNLAAALCDMVKPDVYAVEVGPYAARYVSGLLKMPAADRIRDMKEYLHRYPESMAFLNSRPENDLAAHCIGSNQSSRVELWGLDQEFLGSAGSLLASMEATKPGPQAQEAIALAQAEEKASEARARASENYLDLFIVAATDAQIDALQKAVDADGNTETRKVLYELTESRDIYRLHASDPGASFEKRAELLKQHFLADYRALAATKPNVRVLFKFGDNHMGKGLNATHDLDLGDFIAEQAAAETAASLHILILGLRGTHFSKPGYGKPMEQKSFDMVQDTDYRWLGTLSNQLLPQGPEADGQTLTLFDLRSLRYRQLDMPAEWEKVIYSFDLLVVEQSLTVADEIR